VPNAVGVGILDVLAKPVRARVNGFAGEGIADEVEAVVLLRRNSEFNRRMGSSSAATERGTGSKMPPS